MEDKRACEYLASSMAKMTLTLHLLETWDSERGVANEAPLPSISLIASDNAIQGSLKWPLGETMVFPERVSKIKSSVAIVSNTRV